eukprot:ctg_558.g253
MDAVHRLGNGGSLSRQMGHDAQLRSFASFHGETGRASRSFTCRSLLPQTTGISLMRPHSDECPCCHGRNDDLRNSEPGNAASAPQVVDLYPWIDLDRLLGYNENGSARCAVRAPERRHDDSVGCCVSDADAQCIVHVPFTVTVKLKSIVVAGGGDDRRCWPSHMRATSTATTSILATWTRCPVCRNGICRRAMIAAAATSGVIWPTRPSWPNSRRCTRSRSSSATTSAPRPVASRTPALASSIWVFAAWSPGTSGKRFGQCTRRDRWRPTRGPR